MHSIAHVCKRSKVKSTSFYARARVQKSAGNTRGKQPTDKKATCDWARTTKGGQDTEETMELQYEHIDWGDIVEAELSGDQEALRKLRYRDTALEFDRSRMLNTLVFYRDRAAEIKRRNKQQETRNAHPSSEDLSTSNHQDQELVKHHKSAKTGVSPTPNVEPRGIPSAPEGAPRQGKHHSTVCQLVSPFDGHLLCPDGGQEPKEDPGRSLPLTNRQPAAPQEGGDL